MRSIANSDIIGIPLSDQLWTQDSPGVEGAAEAGDGFGQSLAAGDFNGDGKDDLAIGVPGEDVASALNGGANAGAVNTLYGSGTSLTSTNDQIWTQDSINVEGAAEAGDAFGRSVAAGDFNGDGRDDLAIGVPGDSIGINRGPANAGAVNVLFGSSGGLTESNDQIWHQDITNVEGAADGGDNFGQSLAAGDFNGDGRDDLAIGVPGEDLGSGPSGVNAGAVNVLFGSSSGLTSANDQIWTQDSTNVEGIADAGDAFGRSLATGDFNGDGKDDLAVGVAGEDIGSSLLGAGAMNILYGSNAGLTSTGDQIWTQDSAGVAGAAESGDGFGSSAATGDFNGDGKDDLAVGVTGEDIDSITNAGGVNVLYGSNNGLTSTGNQFWSQNSSGIPGTAGTNDQFGTALAVGDFNGDGRDDLAIGAPGDNISGGSGAGSVNIIYGSSNGLRSTQAQFWSQNSPGVEGSAGSGDRFGSSLTAGDFNNDGFADLAIGIPGESGTGATAILYGSSSGLFA